MIRREEKRREEKERKGRRGEERRERTVAFAAAFMAMILPSLNREQWPRRATHAS